tara:strand:- start:61503 stop:62540 length:1038 start_codon:yes stop_codon:yes gene_type:complete
MTKNKKLKVGIAGYGIVGKRRRFFIDENSSLETVAVCDRTFTEDGTFSDGVRFYQNYKELLHNEELDILFVCLTNDIAAEVTVSGLKRNLHVFCEKPPGRNLADIQSVINAEKEKPSLKLKYGFNHRYHDSVKEAKKILDEGGFGKIIGMRGVYGKSIMLSYNSDWRTKRDVAGGGILLDQGIHMVDLMRFFGGEFKDIKSFVSNDYWNYDIEDNAYALMKSEAGFISMLHSTGTEWRHKFNLHITLEHGALILGGILSSTKSYGSETLSVIYKGDSDGGNPKEQKTSYIHDNSWKDEIEEFAESIIEDRIIETGSSYDAYKSMELVYRIYCADEQWKNKFNINL